jgi:hypothetical protein
VLIKDEEDAEEDVEFPDLEYRLTQPNPAAPPQVSEASPGQGVSHS